jgi:PAS domain S-box-containing protein
MQKRQRVLADFGDFALHSEDLDELLHEACRLVGEALGTGRAKVLEIEAGGQSLFVRAGVGWASDVVGHVRIQMAENSSESFSIRSGGPVISRDITKEDRFDVPPFMKAAGVIALANVPVFLPGGGAYGLLQVDDTKPRDFDENDSEFLRTYASLLGPVIDRIFKLQAMGEVGRRQAFLLRLTDALRAEPSADAVAEVALGMLLDELGLDRCYVATFRKDADRAEIAHQVGGDRVDPMPPSIRLSDHPAALSVSLGRTLVVDDVAGADGLSDTDRQSLAALGAGALIALPMRKGQGDPVWTMVAVSVAPRRWTADEVALLAEAAERTLSAIERARSEEALRASEALLSAAFESAPVGIAVTDSSGATVFANAIYRHFVPAGIIPSRDQTQIPRWRGWDPEGRLLEPKDWPSARALRGERVVPGLEMIHTETEGREVWTSVSSVPIRDLAGSVTGVAIVVADIDAAKRNGEALRESEERFRAIVETARDYAIFTTDAEGRVEIWPLGAEEVFGWTAAEIMGQSMDITFTPEDRQKGQPEKERRLARETGQAANVRWHQRKDGTRVFIEGMVRPIRGLDGSVTGFLKVGQDITERQITEEALRESELRFRNLSEGIPQLVWRAVEYGHWTWASPQWTQFTGQRDEMSLGWGWLEPLHPDDRDSARAAWKLSRETDVFEAEYRLCDHATGQFRWFQSRATPVHDDAGRVVEWLGTSTDVQDLREMQERQSVLMAELQHRTRNLMGVVRSVTDRTLAGSASLEDFGTRIRDRLGALSRVNDLLSRLDEHDRINFDELIRAELEGHGIDSRLETHPKVVLQGPASVRLRSSQVQTLALALHELATNAVKYGALYWPEGRLEITWTLVDGSDGERWLKVVWRESGVTTVPPGLAGSETTPAAPRRRGFGRELIEKALPYQLAAKTDYELTPTGVQCTITIPISTTAGAQRRIKRTADD